MGVISRVIIPVNPFIRPFIRRPCLVKSESPVANVDQHLQVQSAPQGMKNGTLVV